MLPIVARALLFLAAFVFGCSSSSFQIAGELEAGELEAATDTTADTAAKDAGGELEAATDTAAKDAGGELEAATDTAAKDAGGELEADTAPSCSELAPSCCRAFAPSDLAACEAAGAGAPKGWGWTRTANVAFRCKPAVMPPAAQPCAHSYRLGGGELFCCVVGS
jgi:hypothetical protein